VLKNVSPLVLSLIRSTKFLTVSKKQETLVPHLYPFTHTIVKTIFFMCLRWLVYSPAGVPILFFFDVHFQTRKERWDRLDFRWRVYDGEEHEGKEFGKENVLRLLFGDGVEEKEGIKILNEYLVLCLFKRKVDEVDVVKELGGEYRIEGGENVNTTHLARIFEDYAEWIEDRRLPSFD